MASIRKIEGKNGVSYKITVTKGRDLNGRQVRHYLTWTPEPKMIPRQIEKAVQKAAFTFEQEIEKGFAVDNRQTFSEYARYVIHLKEHSGKKTPHHRKLYRSAQADRSGNRPHPPHRTAAAAPQFLLRKPQGGGHPQHGSKGKSKAGHQCYPETKTSHKGRCSGCSRNFIGHCAQCGQGEQPAATQGPSNLQRNRLPPGRNFLCRERYPPPVQQDHHRISPLHLRCAGSGRKGDDRGIQRCRKGNPSKTGHSRSGQLPAR